MALFGRRPVPDAVRAVALEPGERRLAWGLTSSGDAAVASPLGLHLPGHARLDWADVERASWHRPVLGVVRVAEVDGAGEHLQVELAEENGLADVVRTQVTASIAWSTHVRLQPAGGVRVVGRRRPGRDLLDWQLVFDVGTDLQDAQLRAQADAVLLDARRTIG